MIDTPNINKALNLIKKEKKPIIIKAQNLEFNRKILEQGNFDVLLSIEEKTTKNTLRQLDSGLNHVLAKIAGKNKIAIGIDMKRITELEKKEKAETLSRIRQNIRICRKAKAKLILLNYRQKQTSISFLISLGASTKQTKEAIDF